MLRASIAILAVTGAAALGRWPHGQQEQSKPCSLYVDSATRPVFRTEPVTGFHDTYVGGGVLVHCKNDPATTISSDSMVYTESNGIAVFLSRVKYRDSTVVLNGDKVTYYRLQQRLYAEGHVYTRNSASGTELTGPNLDMLRVSKGIRDTQEITATGRPIIHMHNAGDTAGADSARAFIIIANRVHMRHTDRMWASGSVVITRTDMDARSDSAQLLLNDSVGFLIGEPIVVGRDTTKARPPADTAFALKIDTSGADSSIQYRLTGQRIRFNLGAHQQVRRVLSSGDADARGPEWHLSSDTLDMAIDSGRIQRTQAWGRNNRAYAYSGLNTILADSLDIQMPDQVMKQVWAYGHSRATSRADSTATEDDWLSGDSLIANFLRTDTTTRKSEISRVIAFGSARAYYHTSNQRDSTGEKGINYSRGDKINIAMRQCKVHTVDIVGKVDGVYLEPLPPRADSLLADSTHADTTRADTTRSDTTRAPRPTPRP